MLKEANSAKVGGACSEKEKSAGLWKLVWKLNCANKIKHFLWRTCKNILPTNFCLASRRVTLDSRGGLCGGYELSGHALWDCNIAAGVWKEVGLNLSNLK